MTRDAVQVGSMAPSLAQNLHGHPRVLAFVRDWSLAREPPAALASMRARLAALDAELIMLARAGAWSFTGRRDPVCCDRLAANLATTALLYGVRGDGEAVFVIDGRGIVRFAHRPDAPLSATLLEALDAAGEAHQARDRLTRMERVLFSRRDWALTCLVVGCTLTFAGTRPATGPAVIEARSAQPKPPVVQRTDARGAVVGRLGERLERTRFARGTGPVRVAPPHSSRNITTACAPTAAPVMPIAPEPSEPILLVTRKSASPAADGRDGRKPT